MKEIIAALSFFTRIPFYKIKALNVDAKYYKDAVNYWPVAGLLTSGVMILTIWGLTSILSFKIAIIAGIVVRILVTGALHEDGLSDFFDGLGGGTTRQRVLEIMKDSHIGVYGVISLIIYFLLLSSVLEKLSYPLLLILIFVGDPLCKLIASQITRFLPYARSEESSKMKLTYIPMSMKALLISSVVGLAPLIFISFRYSLAFLLAPILPICVFILVVNILKRRIQGYTGDCCGALFLLCELSFYISCCIIYRIY